MVELSKLLPMDVWRSVGLETPKLVAWSSLYERVESNDNQEGIQAVGELIGHLVIGGFVGATVGRCVAATASGAPGLRATLGLLILTENAVGIVDCGYPVSITEDGVAQPHVDQFFRQGLKAERKFKLWRMPLWNVRASLRHEGAVLQLHAPDRVSWQLRIAKIAQDPDASAFVQAMMGLPEIPPVEDFVAQAVKQVPDARLLDAMAADGSIEQVIRRLVQLERERLGPLLDHVSRSNSADFAVRIEAWLTERAEPAGRRRFEWMLAAAAGIACLMYALFQPASHWRELRWAALVACLFALLLAFIWRSYADDAQWFTEQLGRFRAARIRPSPRTNNAGTPLAS